MRRMMTEKSFDTLLKDKVETVIIDDWNLQELTEEQSKMIESLHCILVYGGQVYIPSRYFENDERINVTYTSLKVKNGTSVQGFVLDYERYYSLAGSGMMEALEYSWVFTQEEAEA